MAQFEKIAWPEGKIGIAFSAGKDSTALLALAHKVYPKNQLYALHIDHRARSPESCRLECETADRICLDLNLPIYRETLNRDLKSENEWREARYLALAKLGRQHHLDYIATAHHALDQCETILFNLFRGSDLNGLKGMPSEWTRHGQKFFRPLINFQPQELYDYLEDTSLESFEDPSNENTAFKRNQLRHEILPLLEKFQPGSSNRVTQLGQSIEQVLHWHDQEYHKQTADLIPDERSDNEVSYNREKLKTLPTPILDMWCRERLQEFAKGASKISRERIHWLRNFIQSNELGYTDKVFPGNIQVRARKLKVIFKVLD